MERVVRYFGACQMGDGWQLNGRWVAVECGFGASWGYFDFEDFLILSDCCPLTLTVSRKVREKLRNVNHGIFHFNGSI